MAITTEMRTDVANLYVALFGRAPERDGLGYWVNQIDAGKSIAAVAQEMYNTDPARAYYPTFLTNDEIVTRFYTNVLGRTPDADGLAYWSAKLAATGATKGSVIAEMITAVRAYAGSDAAALTSKALFENKVTVGLYYAVDLGGNDVTKASSILSNVTASASSVEVAKTEAATSAGSTYALTTSGDNLTGTNGNDTFSAAVVGANATGTTLQAGDAANGNTGTDTLSIAVSGDAGGAHTISAVTLQGVERVMLSNFDTNVGATTFDMSLTSGATTVGLSASSATGDTVFSNAANIVGAEMASGSGDLTVNYVSSVVAGTADTQTLALNGVTAGTFTADAGIETVAISSASTATKSTLTALSATGATKLTIDADAALTISGQLDTNIKTVDASASAAGVSIVLGTQDLTVTGGAGNDSIRIDGTTVDTNDSINAGDGTDTLQLTAAVGSATAGAKLAGFENLYIYQDVGATATVTQNASYVSGVTNVGVTKMTYTDDNDATADAATVTANFTNMSATQTMSISGITSAGDADDNGAMTAVVTFDLASDTTNDSGTLTLGTSTAAATVAGANNTITLNVTADDYETLSIVNQGGSQTIGTLTAADATKLNVSASKAFTITTLSGAAVKTIDASASTANVVIGATSVASTITGGAGNDTFTGSGSADSIDGGAGNDNLTGGANNDTIVGGAGNDTITGGADNDKLYGDDGDDSFADAGTGVDYIEGGAGNDTFTVATYSNLTSADTIIGGDGTDTLAIGEDGNIDLTADITQLSNVTGVERISFTGLAGNNDTVTVNDGVVSTTGGTLTLLNASNSSSTWNASGVLASASTVIYTQSSTVTAAQTFSIGNGKDSVTLGSGGDTVQVSNNAYLSSNDTLDGGTGSDTLAFTYNTASSNTISAAQLSNVKGFETFSFANATNGTAVNYVLTLDDTIVGNQVAVGSTFTVSRTAANTGTLKIDGSAVTNSYVLALSGGAGVDTLTGGAGNDTITGAAGNDVLTGGAGNDTFVVTGLTQAANGSDSITDFSFGTSTTAADVIQIDVTSTTKVFGKASTGITAAAGTEILVLDQAAYQDASGAQTAAQTAFGANDSAAEAIVIWQDTLGNLNLSVYADASADANANGTLQNSMVKFSGLTLAGVLSLIDANDFSLI